MPISLTNDMMRSIIMDHYSNPSNKHEPKDSSYEKIHMHSDNCIDDLDIFVKFDGDKVVDACFDGVGCTISTASTDIMCDLIKDKSKEEVNEIINQYMLMMEEEHYDEDILEEANAFKNTSKQAARIKCATIGYRAVDSLIKDKNK